MEVGQAIRAVGHGLAVESYLLRPEGSQSLRDGQELLGPVPAIAAPQAHLLAALARDDAVAVVL